MFRITSVIILVLVDSIVNEVIETNVGSIDGNISIEENGTQLLDETPVVSTNVEIKAQVVIHNSYRLSNVSYSWFVDDIEFKPSLSPQLVYRFPFPKEYKLMAVILAKQCKHIGTDYGSQSNSCDPNFGIIWRKVVAIQRNSTILADMWSEANLRSKKRFSEKEYLTLYSSLIIGGAILMSLIFVSIIIHTISLFNSKNSYNDSKRPLIDRRYDNKYRLYSMDM